MSVCLSEHPNFLIFQPILDLFISMDFVAIREGISTTPDASELWKKGQNQIFWQETL